MDNKVFDAIFKKVENEPYANKLGMKLLKLDYGYSLVEMHFTEDVANIFGMPHGGAIFSLVDEAFETASNSHGTVALALNMNISYLKSPSLGDILYAEAREINKSNRMSNCNIEVRNNRNELIAVCQTIAYRKKDMLPFVE